MSRISPSTRTLTAVAMAALGTFPITVVTLNLVQRQHYSPIRQAISELALGRGGGLMVLAFLSIALGMLLVGVVIRRTTGAVVAPTVLVVASIGAGPLSAVFHTDPSGAKATTHGTIHDLAGLSAFLLVLAAMVVCSRRFRRQPAWRGYALPTRLWTCAAVVAFFLVPALGTARFGLAQRIFIGTFLTWLFATATYARQHVLAADPVALSVEARPVGV